MVSCPETLSAASPKIKGFKGRGHSPKFGDDRNDPFFFAYVIAGSIGFQWATV